MLYIYKTQLWKNFHKYTEKCEAFIIALARLTFLIVRESELYLLMSAYYVCKPFLNNNCRIGKNE